MNPWIGATIAIVAAIIIGSIAARVVTSVIAKSKVDALREASPALSGLALSAAVIIGLLVALGFVAPDELEQLGDDAIAFLPRAISALVISRWSPRFYNYLYLPDDDDVEAIV